MGCIERRNKKNRPDGKAPLGPRKPKAPAGPARKSTRLEGRPAPVYNEAALEKADGLDRKKRGHLPEHHGAASPYLRFTCLPSRQIKLSKVCGGTASLEPYTWL